jgi:hypothetical protein
VPDAAFAEFVPPKCQSHSQFSNRQSGIVHKLLKMSPKPFV